MQIDSFIRTLKAQEGNVLVMLPSMSAISLSTRWYFSTTNGTFKELLKKNLKEQNSLERSG